MLMSRIGLAISNFYFLVSPTSPGMLDFFISILRALLVIFLGLFASYFIVGIEDVEKYWVFYSAFILGVEDVERVNFSRESASPWGSAMFFAVGISIFEFFAGLLNVSGGALGFVDYLLLRIPPTVMHFVFASVAVLLVKRNFLWSLVAITPLHVLFNAYSGSFSFAD